MGKSFKDEFTFEQRLEESQDIIAKYPLRVPVVVERYCKTDLPEMEKKKQEEMDKSEEIPPYVTGVGHIAAFLGRNPI